MVHHTFIQRVIMRTVLLGAGHIGQTIARLLAESGDYNLTLADRDARALKAASALHAEKTLVDSTDPAGAGHAAERADVVINALPYHMAVTVATAARHRHPLLRPDRGCARHPGHCSAGRRCPVAFMPQCGLAPGFIGIAAHHLAAGFEEVRDIKMRVVRAAVPPMN
jgi:saccharopine dehydrogenase-like NADP-dependent oxidoreductase